MTKKVYFSEPDPKPDFPRLEERILSYWEKDKTFQKQLNKTAGGKRYVFYDGPPTANGKPHIGHVIGRAFKDLYPRFKSMQGYHVIRMAGWDTHGLPVEVEVEKALGISGKREIENIVPGDKVASIAKFNNLCRESVWKYVDLWEKMVKRLGHWIDMDHPYITYENDYIESVWWSLSVLYKKGLLYKDYKVVPYCTRCGTPLSSHEVSQEYHEREDKSVYVLFELKNTPNTYLVAWTTTPWTLPGNAALAVSSKLEYAEVARKGNTYIVAKEAAEKLGLETTGKTIRGKDLVGKSYVPPFDYLTENYRNKKDLHTVLPADFVDASEGTGVVHTAVMYGADDFELSKKFDLPKHHLVDEEGKFTREAKDFSGKHVTEANSEIVNNLKKRGLLLKEEAVKHQYPYCWRCKSPLVYYALDSWFIKTTQFKDRLIKHNSEVNWKPEHVGQGRMGNWYETLIDWSISRSRYWGTPLPIWTDEEGNSLAVGSVGELEKLVGKSLKSVDLHRPYVDEIVFDHPKTGKKMRRVPEVIDVWYDSGAMPFAQYHYPKKKDEYKDQFPADYISEAVDQTRGWFFSLQAISTMLFGKSPYKNVVVYEHVLDSHGKKMSKSVGNVVDPWEAIEAVGADGIRWFFFSSVSVGTQYRLSTETLRSTLSGFHIPLWNIYGYFVRYANLGSWEPSKQANNKSKHVLDRWINARLHEVVKTVTGSLENYDSYKASNAIQDFVVKDLSQWYLRRSRDRKTPEFFRTTWEVLVELSKLLAPFNPFFAEYLYQNLTRGESVHLANWPIANGKDIDKKLLKEMKLVREVAEAGLSKRAEEYIKVRQPLPSMQITAPKKLSEKALEILAEEVNVLEVAQTVGKKVTVELDTRLTAELKEMGEMRDIIRQIQAERKKLGTIFDERVDVQLPSWPAAHEKEIKEKALVRRLTKGAFSVSKL